MFYNLQNNRRLLIDSPDRTLYSLRHSLSLEVIEISSALSNSKEGILENHFIIEFGVPPTPTIEGREKLSASFPSISFILVETLKCLFQKTLHSHKRNIKKFGTPQVSNGEEHAAPHVASLSTQSGSLRAAGYFLEKT